ncbi:glycosyl transferase family 8 [Geobacter metallireducens RCH3]|uniref:glycosyltransferase family 8 protein n=1 Tax=Geobacter metallireducens TaxID=28232 RepID=UPI00024A51DB|nr:glycosyltransferase family 8 protein [Geobacter metallireducens]EHP86414.1 glycosyl transferase family 8 [Geobacter metallireducens RCH3]
MAINELNIPVFFAFDNNYVIPAAVAFHSLLANVNVSYKYHFIVLHEDISEENRDLLAQVVSLFSNASVEFRDMGESFKNEWENIKGKGHYTKECLYKLVPMLEFPQYDKIIWSDVDVVFKDDISDVFFMLSEENYIAGVRVCGKLDKYYENMNMPAEIKSILKNGIGAGILVYNLKKMREDNIYDDIMIALQGMSSIVVQPEQDILNIVLKDKIDYIPLRYCFCTYMYNLFKDRHKMKLKVKGNLFNYLFKGYRKNLGFDTIYSEKELLEAFESPAIIHYATSTKPWNTLFTKRKSDWLYCLLKTPFWKRYIFRY